MSADRPSDRLVRLWLRDYSEQAKNVRWDDEYGAIISAEGLRHYVSWTVARGFAKPEKASKFTAWLDGQQRRN